MSRTLKHRIEGLYHHGLIKVEDDQRSVKNGWDRHNAKGWVDKTAGHEKKAKLNRIELRELRQ